jgi:hypothetical protein
VTPPENDPGVADSDTFLRRVPNRPRMLACLANGEVRLSSAALELRSDEIGCSVDILERTVTPEAPLSVLDGFDPMWGLASGVVSDARQEDLHRVVGDPLEDDPAHALIVPTAESRNQQKRNFGSLAKKMVLLREPQIPS